jgi:hypothetical protein
MATEMATKFQEVHDMDKITETAALLLGLAIGVVVVWISQLVETP